MLIPSFTQRTVLINVLIGVGERFAFSKDWNIFQSTIAKAALYIKLHQDGGFHADCWDGIVTIGYGSPKYETTFPGTRASHVAFYFHPHAQGLLHLPTD
jgi:hypothetical protein